MKKLLMLALASAMAFGMSVCAFAAHHPLSKGSLIGEIIYPRDTIEFMTNSSSTTTACSYVWSPNGSAVHSGITFTNAAPFNYRVLVSTDTVLATAGFPADEQGYWIVTNDDFRNSIRTYVNFLWVAAPPAVAGEVSYTEQEQNFWHDDVLTKALQTKADVKTGEKIYTAKIADCYDNVPVGVVDTLRIKNDLTVIFEYKGEKTTLDLSKLPKSEANRVFYPMEYFLEIAGK